MPTHVYANGREIACQAADGIASPAFPEPRFGAVDKLGHKHKLDTPESLAD